MVMEHGLYLGMNAKPWQEIFDISATQKHPLGSFFDDHFGRRFRYCLNGSGALVAGDLVQAAALGGADTTLQTVGIIGANSAVGDTRIYVAALTTAQAASAFANGWAAFEDTSLTATYTRRIKDNSALEHTTWVDAWIDIYEPLPVALVAASDTVALQANLYNGIIQVPATTATGLPIGGVHCAVTAAYYCWAQTRGIFGVHIKDGALVAGDPITTQPTTAGTPIKNTETLFQPHIGWATAAWADEAAGLVMLRCE